jgi:hypothetical protein
VPKKMRKIWTVYPDNGIIWDYVDLVLLEYEDLTKYDVFWEKDGSYEWIYEVKLLKFEEFEKMIQDNIITDSFTVSSYAFLKANKII